MNPAAPSDATTPAAPPGPPASSSGVHDPWDDLTPTQRARLEAYLAEPKELPEPGVDPRTGRALPISQEEMDRRWERYQKRLAEIDAMDDDDPPGLWERFARELNEERRLEGRGPAFAEEPR